MTFDDVEIIQFNDEIGTLFPVRDKKDLDSYTLSQTIGVQQGMDLDEVISRENVYGSGNEDLVYAVAEMNAESLAENDFNLNQLKTINIPVIESK